VDRTAGTCSICGGRVVIPDAWMGMVPPVPTCSRCGARKENPWGPEVKMIRKESK